MNLLEDAQLHLEITSNCNSRCLDCSRYVLGSDVINPWVDTGSRGNMSFETLKNIFDENTCLEIRAINFTGTYGEAIAHPHFLEILHFIGSRIDEYKELRVSNGRAPKVDLLMETNGGIHGPKWWEQLGQLIQKQFSKNSQIFFGIDGVDEQTHQIYRRGISYKKVVNNASAIKKENIKVTWSFIEFKHNEHQVNKAREIAESYGFRFKIRRSRIRHRTQSEIEHTAQKGKSDIRTVLLASTVQKNALDMEPLKEKESAIECEWRNKKQISIDYDGRVWQCCYFSSFNHPRGRVDQKVNPGEEKEKEGLSNLEKNYLDGWNLVTKHKLSTILDHSFFQKDLPKSLDPKNEMLIKRCRKHCGKTSRLKELKVRPK